MTIQSPGSNLIIGRWVVTTSGLSTHFVLEVLQTLKAGLPPQKRLIQISVN
jgi:hypothetical protein